MPTDHSSQMAVATILGAAAQHQEGQRMQQQQEEAARQARLREIIAVISDDDYDEDDEDFERSEGSSDDNSEATADASGHSGSEQDGDDDDEEEEEAEDEDEEEDDADVGDDTLDEAPSFLNDTDDFLRQLLDFSSFDPNFVLAQPGTVAAPQGATGRAASDGNTDLHGDWNFLLDPSAQAFSQPQPPTYPSSKGPVSSLALGPGQHHHAQHTNSFYSPLATAATPAGATGIAGTSLGEMSHQSHQRPAGARSYAEPLAATTPVAVVAPSPHQVGATYSTSQAPMTFPSMATATDAVQRAQANDAFYKYAIQVLTHILGTGTEVTFDFGQHAQPQLQQSEVPDVSKGSQGNGASGVVESAAPSASSKMPNPTMPSTEPRSASSHSTSTASMQPIIAAIIARLTGSTAKEPVGEEQMIALLQNLMDQVSGPSASGTSGPLTQSMPIAGSNAVQSSTSALDPVTVASPSRGTRSADLSTRHGKVARTPKTPRSQNATHTIASPSALLMNDPADEEDDDEDDPDFDPFGSDPAETPGHVDSVDEESDGAEVIVDNRGSDTPRSRKRRDTAIASQQRSNQVSASTNGKTVRERQRPERSSASDQEANADPPAKTRLTTRARAQLVVQNATSTACTDARRGLMLPDASTASPAVIRTREVAVSAPTEATEATDTTSSRSKRPKPTDASTADSNQPDTDDRRTSAGGDSEEAPNSSKASSKKKRKPYGRSMYSVAEREARKRERNRLSAQRSRLRKKEQADRLRNQIVEAGMEPVRAAPEDVPSEIAVLRGRKGAETTNRLRHAAVEEGRTQEAVPSTNKASVVAGRKRKRATDTEEPPADPPSQPKRPATRRLGSKSTAPTQPSHAGGVIAVGALPAKEASTPVPSEVVKERWIVVGRPLEPMSLADLGGQPAEVVTREIQLRALMAEVRRLKGANEELSVEVTTLRRENAEIKEMWASVQELTVASGPGAATATSAAQLAAPNRVEPFLPGPSSSLASATVSSSSTSNARPSQGGGLTAGPHRHEVSPALRPHAATVAS